jgi:predicted ATPase
MIQSLSIRNFKALREVDVELRPLTVIVGPNASGKSSILQAIAILSRCASGDTPSQLLRGEWSQSLLRCQHSTGFTTITCHLKVENKSSYVELDISKGAVSLNRLERWGSQLLHLEPTKLSAASYPKEVSLSLPGDGEGLSSVLAGLYLERPERFSAIIGRLKSVVPSLLNIRVKRVPVEPTIVGYELLFDMKGAEGIPAIAVSEGTLLTLGFLTALSMSDAPQVILIDEMERSLHPKALGELVQQVRRLQEQDPTLQVVATSHSPYLLDHLHPEEVLLTSLSEEGHALVRPLTQHPDYERWKDLMAPGEFWSTVGEDWIVKEKKATA